MAQSVSSSYHDTKLGPEVHFLAICLPFHHSWYMVDLKGLTEPKIQVSRTAVGHDGTWRELLCMT